MMRQIITFLFLSVSMVHGYAQTLTLQTCIDRAIDRNLEIGNARIGIAKGKTGVSQNRARLLPVIQAVGQFTDYLKSPVNVTTGTLLGSDFPDNPTWQTIKSMPYNAQIGVQMALPIYDQTVLASVHVARTVAQISELTYEQAVEELTVQIGNVYYRAQAAKAQKALAEANVARMDELYRITQALYGQGVVMEVDLNRVHINRQMVKVQHEQYQMLYEQHLHLLRYLLDMAPETPLEVTDMPSWLTDMPLGAVSATLPELRLAEQQGELAKKRIQATKAGYLPTLSLTGYVGMLGYQDRFCHFFHTSAATDNWFGNCFVSVSVRIPIFETNARKLQIRQYQYDVQQADNRRIQLQRRLDERHAHARLQLNHQLEVYRTQLENYRQAQAVYAVTEEQYKEGVASMTALLQDEMQLRTAQQACVQAHCQYRLARLDLLKLSGGLDKLSE